MICESLPPPTAACWPAARTAAGWSSTACTATRTTPSFAWLGATPSLGGWVGMGGQGGGVGGGGRGTGWHGMACCCVWGDQEAAGRCAGIGEALRGLALTHPARHLPSACCPAGCTTCAALPAATRLWLSRCALRWGAPACQPACLPAPLVAAGSLARLTCLLPVTSSYHLQIGPCSRTTAAAVNPHLFRSCAAWRPGTCAAGVGPRSQSRALCLANTAVCSRRTTTKTL